MPEFLLNPLEFLLYPLPKPHLMIGLCERRMLLHQRFETRNDFPEVLKPIERNARRAECAKFRRCTIPPLAVARRNHGSRND